FFFQAEDGIRDRTVTGVQTCALPIYKQFPASVFKYRGLFINDEDLLTGWAPGEAKDHTGISLEVWNKIFETILRLKGNMVAPGRSEERRVGKEWREGWRTARGSVRE